MPDERSNIPIPDPSELTTLQLQRELAMQGMLFSAKLETMALRIDYGEKRSVERSSEADLRYQQRFDASGLALSAASASAQSGINAALAAAKEAVLAASINAEKAVAAQNEANATSIAKSESSVAKQIDAINAALITSANTLNEKIGALTGRMDRGEGSDTGTLRSRTDRRSDTVAMTAMVVAGISAISLALAFYHLRP